MQNADSFGDFSAVSSSGLPSIILILSSFDEKLVLVDERSP